MFGGYDETRVKAGHELQWFDTVHLKHWALPVQSIKFYGDNFLSNKT